MMLSKKFQLSYLNMAASKPLLSGKKYHFNIIYNHALSRYSTTPDTELSLRFVEFLVGKLSAWGYTEFYYHDEHALPGRNVFEELFRVVNGSQWSFVILTKEFSSNCWVKYCQMAAFKNLIDKTQRDRLIPITVGNVQLPVELEVNGVLSFDDDLTTWDQGHISQLNRLQRVLAENISVAVANEVEAVQDHGDGIVRSERDHIITETQPSIQESLSDLNLNSHIEVDGSTSFDNTDGSTQHPNANDGIGEMEQNTDMNPARTSNHHYPQSVLAHSPTTDTATNIQGEQIQTDTDVKETSVSNTENTHNRSSNIKHDLPISSSSRPVSTNASPNTEGLSPQDSASQGRTTLCQLDQTEYKANTQASSESNIQVSSLAREATSGIAKVESGPTIKMEHIYNSHRSGKPLNSSEGQSNLQSVRESNIDVASMQDSVDGLPVVEEIVSRQSAVTTSMAAGCIPRPELSQGKTEQNRDVDILPCEAEYVEQRMKELNFDCGEQYVDNSSLSKDKDITLDQEWSNLQCEDVSITEQTRPEVLLNDFTQGQFEQEGLTLNIDSLINNGISEQRELTEPKHKTSSSDAGYISADNISNNSISSHPGEHHWEGHTDCSDRMDVKTSSVESDPNKHMGNSKYSGDVKSGNYQMAAVDLKNKERLVCTREKESKSEKVTDNKNKDEEVPVRGESPRPSSVESDPNKHMGNSKYSGNVKSGNNQMDVVDLIQKERLVCTSGMESKPEKVTDNKNKDEEVPVRVESPRPSSVESDPNKHMGNSKYSGNVKSGNNQMDEVDLIQKERLVCTSGKESKPEKVTDNENKDEEVPVRGELPRPVGFEADASFSMISTSRSMAREIDGYREVLVRSIIHIYTKTDMLSSWS
ncbi:hypothetical protein ACJMK2_005547 [Sinanodonta woodiana]|uniref:TIR domain-containing protein n=1 Tax=Sinanodonta woodiana TaxID=1069815 RepID=A0ABD3VTW6_SINWO